MSKSSYKEKEKKVLEQFKELISQGGKNISLKPKKTTHIMRQRKKKHKLDLTFLDQVIKVKPKNLTAEIEGSTNFRAIVEKTLKYNLLPKVVPEFGAITLGGAISGLALESSSFKYGMVHETLSEVTLLTPDGQVRSLKPGKNSNLFNTLPNAFGTVGYVLKAKIKLVKATSHIKTTLEIYRNAKSYFKAVREKTLNSSCDFIDGVIFSKRKFVLLMSEFVEENQVEIKKIPNLYKTPYYKYLKQLKDKELFYLKTKDYIWRWDKDAFWGINYEPLVKSLLHSSILRETVLRRFLRTDHLLRAKKVRDKIFEFLRRFPVFKIERIEELIQDAGIEVQKCPRFFNWYKKNIAVYPIWICPVIKRYKDNRYPLYNFKGDIIIDFGFYSNKKLKPKMDNHHYNKLFEKELSKLDSVKGLYSKNSYSKQEFWVNYNKSAYMRVKKKYDPQGLLPDLYEKAMS